MLGPCLGARQPGRAREAIIIATRFTVVFLGVISLLFVLLSRPIVSMFTSDAEVIDFGTHALRIVSLGLPLYAVGMCMGAVFNGAGDARTPTRVNLFCLWLGQVPLAWILSHVAGLGPIGVFAAVTLSFSAQAVWSTLLFQRGRWLHQRI